jgi:hypothetical protein
MHRVRILFNGKSILFNGKNAVHNDVDATVPDSGLNRMLDLAVGLRQEMRQEGRNLVLALAEMVEMMRRCDPADTENHHELVVFTIIYALVYFLDRDNLAPLRATGKPLSFRLALDSRSVADSLIGQHVQPGNKKNLTMMVGIVRPRGHKDDTDSFLLSLMGLALTEGIDGTLAGGSRGQDGLGRRSGTYGLLTEGS